MAEKVNYKLKGHEKFPLREGWLNKGLMAVTINPKVFSGNEGPDHLGVGTNMVKSIRHWMQSCNLIEKRKDGEFLTDLAEIIKEKDPYFEDSFTLWILHSNLAKNIGNSTIWYLFFNKFKLEEFNKNDLMNQMQIEIFKIIGKSAPKSSIKDDIDVMLNMYSKVNLKNDDPEDKNICPFSNLGLIKKEDDIYTKVQPDLRKINEMLILYEVSCLFENEKSLSIDRISTGENSLGALYHLSRVSINHYLDVLDTMEYIKVDRTAGLDMVYSVNIKSPLDIVWEYYNR